MRIALSRENATRRLVLDTARGTCESLGQRFPDALCDNLEGDIVRFRVLRVLRVTQSHMSPIERDELIREYLTP